MRIAFLSQPSDPYTRVRLNYFASQGHKVFSIVFHANSNKSFNPKNKQDSISGVEIISLPYHPLASIPFLKRILYAKKIKELTSEYSIDVFCIVSALNSFYLKASNAKHNFIEIQGSDVIRGPRKYPFLRLYYKYFWKFADGIIQDSELARTNGQPFMPENIVNETIEIGVDFSVFNANVEKGLVRKKYNLGDRKIIFHSRNMNKLYNVETIIKAIPIVKKLYTDICFIFTGEIKYLQSNLRKFITDKRITDNIIFVGRLDHIKEMKYFNMDADIMVSIPSSDSSPFSVYESMATKTPTIVSDLPWLKGKFVVGKHISVVKNRDASSLAEKILQLLNNEITLDLDAAYSIVFERINMLSENKKLETLFECQAKI